MNIEQTEVVINGVKYVQFKEGVCETSNVVTPDGLRAVLIRSYAAGVHFGFLKDEKFTESGKVVTLIKTRRIWAWSGAASLSQMAIEGVKNPSNCKFSVVVPEMEIVNVIETIPLTSAAFDNLSNVPVWKN